MIKDFIDEPVVKVINTNILCFGKIIEQEIRNKWLWFNIDWKDLPAPMDLPQWHRCNTVIVINKEKITNVLESL
jgi:nitrogen fixation protein